AAVALDDLGLHVEIVVQHLDHHLGRHRLGEGGVAADVGEERGDGAAHAAAGDAPLVGGADGGDGAVGDELQQLQALAELADHRVHAGGEVADLVAGGDALDAGGEVALPYPFGDGADL